MPVITQSNDLELDNNNVEINDFWNNKELGFNLTEQTKIISLTKKIDSVDPLACLQKFVSPNTLHFYWENPSKQESVAAWGVTKSKFTPSNSRFALAQDFLQNCFQQTIRKGDPSLGNINPSIFCSFTFFAECQEDAVFSAATLFLPRFQVVKKKKKCFLIINFPLQKSQNQNTVIQEIEQSIDSIDWSHRLLPPKGSGAYKLLRKPQETAPSETARAVGQFEPINSESDRNCLSSHNSPSQNSNYFKSVVADALNSITTDEFSKIVIAHTTDIKSPTPFQLIESLKNLRELHPDCYIFSTSNGRGQNFIGASPERLVSIQNKQLVTDALAGSAPRGKTNNEDLNLANLLLRNRKEKREHKAVSDFIMKRLRQIGLKPQQLPLQLLKLSNIQHLWTPIYAPLPAHIKPLKIVEQLHPTPAVAGVPTETACQKICHYEQFDRSLYAAPLGWVDYEGNCEFVVGIRSALIDGDRARLYAGAGIVSGSNPTKEFAEVQLKLESLLKALV